MLWTFANTADGALPPNRVILFDVEGPRLDILAENPGQMGGITSTLVTYEWGAAPQGGYIVDLEGNLIAVQPWERPEMLDEVLSNVFGLEVGF